MSINWKYEQRIRDYQKWQDIFGKELHRTSRKKILNVIIEFKTQ